MGENEKGRKIEIKFSGEVAGEIMQYLTDLRTFNNEERVRVKKTELEKADHEWITVEYILEDFKTQAEFFLDLETLVEKMCSYLLEQPTMQEEQAPA